jgi:hypothetical protein
MLELFAIDESQIRQLVDDRPFHADEQETLLKILLRLPQFGRDRIQAWCRESDDWSSVAAAIEENRLDFFRLTGRVTRVERRKITQEAASRFGFSEYYRVRLRLAGGQSPMLVFTRNVPSAWLSREDLNEPAGTLGLLLKRGASDGGSPQLFFAAERIAWHPDRLQPQAGIGPSHVLLGELGMDVGLFDVIRETNRRGLTPEDTGAFYQMLAAVRRAAPADLYGQATVGLDIEPLLTRPEDEQGRLIAVQGTARRVQKILVGDDAVRQRFGFDHYYQVDIFVPLGDQEVRLASPDQATEEEPVFTNAYPVNVCVPELPAGLPVSDDLRQEVLVAGFFFKLWAYRTEYVSSFDPEQRQIGPLLIATVPKLVSTRTTSNPLWGWIGGASFLAVLAALMVAGWFYRRSDRRFQQNVLRRRIVGDQSSEIAK